MRHGLELIVAILILVGLGASPLAAQESGAKTDRNDPQYLLPVPELKPDPAIPTSEKVLRYRWGDDISSHSQIETYLKALAKAAPKRTRLVQYGGSYEERSLNYLVISSPANIARLESLRRNNLLLGDPRKTSPANAEAMIEKSPAVIWLAYCVHGNEISPSDAALLTAYHLLADTRKSTKEMLENLIVVIDPLQNPDGRDRFVNVYRETRGVFDQSFRSANEHAERWPSGRSNHYWFDMNRDWFRHSQKEVKAKVAAYLDWQPQMYIDAHEMGPDSSFYFPPPTDPKNPYLLPTQHEWFGKLGKHQAGWFDKYGFGYMTREVFDAFYPGYGSEWPTLQGGLGILWEQASARGRVIDRSDSSKMTYHAGVRNHYISGLATLEFAAANRKKLLKSFYEAKKNAIQLGVEGKIKHYFIPVNQRPQRAKRFVEMLRRNGIEVNVVDKAIKVECFDVKNNQSRTRNIAAGSYHINVAQPGARLLRALLDRNVEMDEKFLRRQLERNQLRLPDEIYDVTAWSMPLAFDLECLATDHDVHVNSKPIAVATASANVKLGKARVAYLMPGTDGAMKAVADLLQKNVRVHVCDETFTLEGRDYDRGTVIVKVAENGNDLHETMTKTVAAKGVQVIPVDTAYVERGAHMGGPQVRWVRPPKVLIVVNRPTNYSSGHTWHLFDQVLNYPTTRVNGRDFGRIKLEPFNIIVLPDGSYASDLFGESTAKKIQKWVRDGGTLITLRGATQWAASEKVGLIKNQVLKRKVQPAVKSSDKEDASKREPEKVTPDNVPGAFFRANVFQKHWVTFGFDSDVDIFYSGRLVLSPTSETAGRSLLTFEKKSKLLTSGFCWPASLDLLAESPYAVHRSIGGGQVIAFVDDPNFRAMYPALQRLFINSVFFGPAHTRR